MSVFRNLDGFSTVAASNPWAAYDRPDPTKWAVWFEDFLMYDKAQDTAYYTLTQTNGVDTITGPTGVLNLTLGGADNDLAELNMVEAPFQTNAKKMFLTDIVFYSFGSKTFSKWCLHTSILPRQFKIMFFPR